MSINKALLIGAVLVLSLLSGCIGEYETCLADESVLLYVKVIDSHGNDITAEGRVAGADLFVFEQDGLFIHKISLTQEEIALRTPVKSRRGLAVVGWGNLDDRREQVSEITTLSASSVSLRDPSVGGSDLFYGLKSMAARVTGEEIVISPKMAQLSVTVRGVPSGTAEADYSLRVRLQNKGYTFGGEPIEEPFELVSRLQYSGTHLVTPAILNVIHARPEATNGLVVDLFFKDQRIARVDKDSTNRPILPKEGRVLNIDMHLSSLTVRIEVTEWNELFQWTDY